MDRRDSSAARNASLIDQQLLEANGQIVVDMKDKEDNASWILLYYT